MSDINVTVSAAAYITRQIEKRGRGIGIRITIVKSGCSGWKYELSFVDQPEIGDNVFPFNEKFAVYVDPKSLQYIKGSTLDLVRRQINDSLELINPNAKSKCKCGASFDV